MLPHSIFKEAIPVASSDLSLLTLILLNTWVLIRLKGKDAIQYLHNQFTCDIKNLNKYQYSFSTHCNIQGKMITNMYVFHFNDQEIAYIVPKSIAIKQVLAIQKYAIFSDVTITPDYNALIIGIIGLHTKKYLSVFFSKLPDSKNTVISYQDITIIYFNLPIERFLLIITNKLLFTTLVHTSHDFSAQYNDYTQWIALDIEAGYPYIGIETSELFFPQAANMNTLNGISFNKGCFLGQEILARIQYRKLNKKSLYHLFGKLNTFLYTYKNPLSGKNIELKMHNQNWKKIGTILQSCQIEDNYIWIQAILNKPISSTDCLRVQNTILFVNLI